MAAVHTAVDIEVDMAAAVDIEVGMMAAAVHTAVGIEVVFVADTEVALIVRPAVEAVMDTQEDSLADIALGAANIADMVTTVEVDIQGWVARLELLFRLTNGTYQYGYFSSPVNRKH